MSNTSSKLTMRVEAIGPDLAWEYLTRPGSRNRPKSEKIIDEYAATMKRKAWRLTGQGIILASDGSLLDGQHRLEAVIRSGETVEMFVVEGVDPACFGTIDVGYTRKPAHYLGMQGERNTTQLAALLRLVQGWEREWATAKVRKLGADEMDELLKRHPATRVSVAEMQRYTTSYPFRGRVSRALFCFCHYGALVTGESRAEPDEFLAGVMRGLNLGERDPRYILRQHFLVGTLELGRADQDYILGRIIHAWNLWSAGKSCQYLRVEGVPRFTGEERMWEQLRLKGSIQRIEEAAGVAARTGGVDRTDEAILAVLRGGKPQRAEAVAKELKTSLDVVRDRLGKLKRLGLVEFERISVSADKARSGWGGANVVWSAAPARNGKG